METACPSRDEIDRALACLDPSLAGSHATGVGIADAPILVVHRGDHQNLSDRCGIWTVDRGLVGYVGTSAQSQWVVGRVDDAAGRLLGERVSQLRSWHQALSTDCVMSGSQLLATIRYIRGRTEIELSPSTRSWTGGERRGWYTVTDGEVVLATGRRRRTRWSFLVGKEPTTALTLHPTLDLDQRVVVLLLVIGLLGPPDAEPDYSAD